jgi:hypothetical protein
MIKIQFRNMLNNELLEKEFNVSENHAIELLKREYASIGIKIINVEDLEEQELYNKIDETKQNQVNDTIKQIKSTIKAFIKKPYDSKNQKRNKTIQCKYINEIETFLNETYDKYFQGYLIDNKIEISTMLNKIYIAPTEEYFLKAD